MGEARGSQETVVQDYTQAQGTQGLEGILRVGGGDTNDPPPPRLLDKPGKHRRSDNSDNTKPDNVGGLAQPEDEADDVGEDDASMESTGQVPGGGVSNITIPLGPPDPGHKSP